MSLEDPFFVVKQEVIAAIGTSRALFQRWYDLAHLAAATAAAQSTTGTAAATATSPGPPSLLSPNGLATDFTPQQQQQQCQAELEWTANELKNSLRSIDWDLEDLEETISIVGKNPKKFKISDVELTERKTFIDKTRASVKDMRDELLNGNPNWTPSTTSSITCNSTNKNYNQQLSISSTLPPVQQLHTPTGTLPILNGNILPPPPPPLASSQRRATPTSARTPILGVAAFRHKAPASNNNSGSTASLTTATNLDNYRDASAAATSPSSPLTHNRALLNTKSVPATPTSGASVASIVPPVSVVRTAKRPTTINTKQSSSSGGGAVGVSGSGSSKPSCRSSLQSAVSTIGSSAVGSMSSAMGKAGGRQDRYTRLNDRDTEIDVGLGDTSPQYHNDNTTSSRFFEDVHRQQQTLITAQDDQIDHIGDSVRVLKDISGQIGNELDEQAVMLDDFAHEMDQTQSRLDNVMQKMSKVMGMSTDRRQWCAIGVLSVIMLIVILLFFLL